MVELVRPGRDPEEQQCSTTEGLLSSLFGIDRALSGPGAAAFLAQIGTQTDLVVHRVPVGTPCFDWEVPPGWTLSHAKLSTVGGERLLDAEQTILNSLIYGTGKRGHVSRATLLEHLWTLPDLPHAIPYRTAYYARNWGFCATHSLIAELEDPEYVVEIESELVDSDLLIGELRLEGTSGREVVFTSYYCHPRQAHDGLSGVVTLLRLYEALKGRPLRHTYRFFFWPETIGAIAAISEGIIRPEITEYALVATCLGAGDRFTYKKSISEDHAIDHVVEDVLNGWEGASAGAVRPYWPTGSDERQLGSPSVRIPTGSIMRTPYAEFDEYHTSLDDLSFVTSAKIDEAVELYATVVDAYESVRRFTAVVGGGEPFFQKRNLYLTRGGEAHGELQVARNWIMQMSDGTRSTLEIAKRSGLPSDLIDREAGVLEKADLLRESGK